MSAFSDTILDSSYIKKLAAESGFDLCGITTCRLLAQNKERFSEWLAKGYHSTLGYLERNSDKRFDPRLLFNGARTVVVCAVCYKNEISNGYPSGHEAKIASYACAADYHTTIRQMLDTMLRKLKEHYPSLSGRAFTDTAPLAEKQLAVEAGLGWIGRQSLLITPQYGSFVLLGELLLTAGADTYDTPLQNGGCGACRRCIDNCPTQAITELRMIDTRRCISCRTIEQKFHSEGDYAHWIFGCDACQSCCPHNSTSPRHHNQAFAPLFDPRDKDAAFWLSMSEEKFADLCGKTPMTRSGLQRIQQNLKAHTTNS